MFYDDRAITGNILCKIVKQMEENLNGNNEQKIDGIFVEEWRQTWEWNGICC